MTLHLAEIAATAALGAHAVQLLDQAGWHGSNALIIPPNITLRPLPSKRPELDPVDNIWQFIRHNWLSNRIYRSYEYILDHCCFALEPPRRSAMALHVRRPSKWAHAS